MCQCMPLVLECSEMFTRVVGQTFIPYAISYAICIGPMKSLCEKHIQMARYDVSNVKCHEENGHPENIHNDLSMRSTHLHKSFKSPNEDKLIKVNQSQFDWMNFVWNIVWIMHHHSTSAAAIINLQYWLSVITIFIEIFFYVPYWWWLFTENKTEIKCDRKKKLILLRSLKQEEN